ncbi:hypothetical protein BD410DRAFT_193950 [Rickenella mellea]|uniref:Uncharacterized protein n=1 Tax=Rickenella mellea TaxID=50990 RepID=A0A4Y7Q4X0_9AGAM|nr:hypothetical protein BD410DRAFT_193950 [Rickenella mellea]
MSLYNSAAAAELRLLTGGAQIFDDTNPLFDYQGHWTVINQVEEFNSSSHIASASDAAAEIGPFRGTFIWVYGTIITGQPAVQFSLDHALSNDTKYYAGSVPSYHRRLYASQLDPRSDHVLEMKTIDHGNFTLDFAVVGNFRPAIGQVSKIDGGSTNTPSSVLSKSSTIPVQPTISNSHITALPPHFITAAVTPSSLADIATDVVPTVTTSSSTETTLTSLHSETSIPSIITPIQPVASGSGSHVADMCMGSTMWIVGAFLGVVVLLGLFTLSLHFFCLRRTRLERSQLSTRPKKLQRRLLHSLISPRSPILPCHRRCLATMCQPRRNTRQTGSRRDQTQYLVHDRLLSSPSSAVNLSLENDAAVLDISWRQSSGISFATRVTYGSTSSSASDDETDGEVWLVR